MRRGLVAAALLALALGACGGTLHPDRAAQTATSALSRTTTTARPKRKSLLLRNARPQASWRTYTGPVPILVYHALGPAPPGAPFPGLYVSYGDFKDEMA